MDDTPKCRADSGRRATRGPKDSRDESHRHRSLLRWRQHLTVILVLACLSEISLGEFLCFAIAKCAAVIAAILLYLDKTSERMLLQDIAARQKTEQQTTHDRETLIHLAYHDHLTDSLNRLGLERALPDILTTATAENRCVAIFFVDLDNFKTANDLLGHACGDKLLRAVAQRLRHCVCGSDLVVRLGGDEFVVVACDLHSAQSASAIAARLSTGLAAPFDMHGHTFKVTASIGISIYPQHGCDTDALLEKADLALYKSKQSGRDTYTLFTPDIWQEELSAPMALRHAHPPIIRQ